MLPKLLVIRADRRRTVFENNQQLQWLVAERINYLRQAPRVLFIPTVAFAGEGKEPPQRK